VRAPGETLHSRGREGMIFLGVVEVVNVELGLVLVKRRRREDALAVSLKRAEIVPPETVRRR